MAVAIRLARHGSKKKPFYRVVVADKRSPRDGRCIEYIGFYDPKGKPVELRLDFERIRYWLDHGAQPSETVKKLLKRAEKEAAPEAAAPTPPAPPAAAPTPAEAQE